MPLLLRNHRLCRSQDLSASLDAMVLFMATRMSMSATITRSWTVPEIPHPNLSSAGTPIDGLRPSTPFRH
jgi:hypothetical protein